MPSASGPPRASSPGTAAAVRSLRERGVITGARLEVDLGKIDRPIQALVATRVRPPTRANIAGFREWTAGLPEVLGVFVTSGSEDFLIHVAIPDNDHLYALVIDRLTEKPEVADVRTSIVYERLRPTTVLPRPTAPAGAPRRQR